MARNGDSLEKKIFPKVDIFLMKNVTGQSRRVGLKSTGPPGGSGRHGRVLIYIRSKRESDVFCRLSLKWVPKPIENDVADITFTFRLV